MHTFHVIKQVPSPGKSIASDRAIAFRKVAQMGFFAMAMHSMSFTLMAQETRRRGELGFGAGRDLAAVGFEVGVQVFAEQRY